ncbi:hypothetical protein F9U64_15090 [Gracilibacillus oryzae]|uniref:Metallo-beta-lactamase domain-containing protein n=1 Tax=Gracilibacillus oryzae TaxID=1672701 RepID=A0A7C8KSP7_9BACI|nr:MBL fold metallo-hydrolase [Gracilibacillus oryzae]KAB8129334.1 hypothetical protein F9U64_15090 [Gracilibacillus oryzae]
MTRTTLTFWSGLRTIGGNIVEICHGDDRVIFDFGLVYDPKSSFLNKATISKKTYTADMLKLGAIPAIDEIYSSVDLEQMENVKPYDQGSSRNTAVYISHLHLDHIGAIDTIAEQIPVYMSEDSKKLYEAFCKTDQPFSREREVTGVTYQKEKHMGQIKITPFQTDHDVFGAMALLIETPDVTILYSGDIRMHGKHPEYNERMLAHLAQVDIDLLLIEGTAFRPEELKVKPLLQIESDIQKHVVELIATSEKLALFNLYHLNLDRIQQFIAAAKETSREIVFEVETAYIVDQLLPQEEIAVYDNERMNYETDWKQVLINKYPRVTNEQINKNPGNYLVQSSFQYVMNLLDISENTAVYLHSNGMPLGKFDPNYDRLLALLAHLDVEYHSLDVSGHATEEDILEIIAKIHPQLVIPWHSHYPELVVPKDPDQAVFLPKPKTVYYFNDGQLKEGETEQK